MSNSNRTSSKVEDELKCQLCKQWFQSPLLLPCGHSICSTCASHRLHRATDPDSESVASNSSQQNLLDDTDGGSTVSEADSGVVLSRPTSYISSSSLGSLLPAFPASTSSSYELGCSTTTSCSTSSTLQSSSSVSAVYKLTCRVCRRVVYLGDRGVDCLPKNRALENLIKRYTEKKLDSCQAGHSNQCQLCEENARCPAVKVCEQCETLYCAPCLDRCHPARGPLAKHTLLPVEEGLAVLTQKRLRREWACSQHHEERLDLYCTNCRIPMCCRCVQEGSCIRHQVHPLSTQCKMHKSELSRVLQSLSEQAKTGTEFVQSLKASSEKVNKHMSSLESEVNQTIDGLLEQLEEKRSSLLAQLTSERDHKQRVLREQVSQCSGVISRTTGLIHFSVEMLKEPDPGAFILVSSSLLNRATRGERHFTRDLDHLRPRVRREFEMKLELEAVERAVDAMAFHEFKAPDSPRILRESCSIEANCLTVVWAPSSAIPVDGYSLEIDDGFQGSFKVAYRGSETICTIEHLHFGASYRLRVKASNYAGSSHQSEVLVLKTTSVSFFRLDACTSHRDLIFSPDNLTVTAPGDSEDRVVLGSTGFTRGIHYWQFRLDKFEGAGQPAFGIARTICSRDKMLGSDSNSWSMYLNPSRSWFLHAGEHSDRTDGGISQSALIGVRLDCDKGTLSFYLNSVPHGPIAFSGLVATTPLYPAVSVSHGVQVTLVTGLEPPSESEESSSEEEELGHRNLMTSSHHVMSTTGHMVPSMKISNSAAQIMTSV